MEMALGESSGVGDKDFTQDTPQTGPLEQIFPYLYTITCFSHFHNT